MSGCDCGRVAATVDNSGGHHEPGDPGCRFGKPIPRGFTPDEMEVDAYVKEAAKIAKRQAALDEDFQALRALVAEKSPHLFEGSTDFLWAGADAAEKFGHYLQGREHYRAWLDGRVD